ncbi:MAG: hypothetical protein EOP85_22345 [Verrucomicrobiaceae bacterium]|nr:MAG: hypothetical protein EOP85_22345 [Verrucomicrobiaceae bacterium]
MKFQPGKVQLAARFDMEPGSPGTDALLYFHRGTILPKETTSATDRARSGQEISRVTFRAVKVGTAAAMEWLRSVQPEAIQSDAWARVLELEKIGAVTLLSELSSKAAPGLPFNVESVREMSYPTEWRPAGGKTAKKEAEEKNITDPAQLGKPPSRPGLADASLGISFDTRNLGVSAEATLTLADDGLLLKYRWSRVNHVATSVHRRILVDGDWIPDVTMPVFSSQGIESTLRLVPGKWTLAGLTPHVNEAGKFDRENCLVLFVKAE